MSNNKLLQVMGPGLLLAAVSVGVSHLVQSTRAGAIYGFAMLVFILFGLLTKYPAFRFGQQYAVITGMTLLEGFRRQGTWALILYFLLSLASMFTGVAAVTLVTASLAKVSFSIAAGSVVVSACLLTAGLLLLTIGRYHLLDLVIKALVLIMTVSTIVATALAVPLIDWSVSVTFLPSQFDIVTLFFIATVIGWMPAPLETAIMQSVWVVEKEYDSNIKPGWKLSSMDFHTGYIGTGILAVCFLILGTAVMHGPGIVPDNTATGFAAQLISVYEQTLGSWSRLLISIAAFAVMLSTMLTILDAYPRTIATLFLRFRYAETPHKKDHPDTLYRIYLSTMIIIVIGAMSVQLFLMKSFTTLIGIATAISFVSAPLIAWLVHRSIASPEISSVDRPGRGLLIYSQVCIGLMGLFALFYIYLLSTN